ncbi:hypothetical protein [Mucilaginibacter sp. OK098]|nr:hypothetical protein [Mucilaginibacter sp. OK098]SHM46041.1 hypothetical protein SAMN05216524_102180 [Mucilaginibacter sp. OK098]
MSKDRKTVKEVKKAPAVNGNKKVSSYQSEKGSKSESNGKK